MKTVTLGEICLVESGGTPSRKSPANFGGNIPWVKIGDMLQGTITRTDEALTELGLSSSSAKVWPVGTLLVSIFATIGRTAVLGIPAASNQAIAGLQVDSNCMITSYLRHYLDSSVGALAASGRGIAQNNINMSMLKDWPVPLPSLDEQQRIAAILDKADELRTKRRQALAYLETLTQSIFHSIFGEAPNSWPETTVEDLADESKGSIRTGPFGSQLLTSEFTDEGVAVLGIDNAVSNEFVWRERRFISFEKYDSLKRYTVKPGDLLVTIMGTLGRCAVVPADVPLAINTKHLCCITVDSEQVIPEWLHAYFLRSDDAAAYLRQTTKGAIMGGLNMGIIKKMPVRLPPLELQKTFAKRVAAVERLKENHRQHLAELDTLFASLQHRAFKGEL